ALMAWISVRPMRPPAPATTSRMSEFSAAIRSCSVRRGYSGGDAKGQTHAAFILARRPSRLRAVIALDNDKVGDRVRLPHSDIGLVFGRAIAGHRGLVIGKFDHDVARAAAAFDALEFSTTHNKAAAEFAEDRRIGGGVRLVAFLVVDVDATD